MDASVSIGNRSRRGFDSLDIRLIAVLAALYFAAGWAGLTLAVPPGYATLLWPSSGIAMGAVIVAGPRIWPGIFLGAALLNFVNAEVANASTAAVALVIATGSTLQSLAGASLAHRLLGRPLNLKSIWDAVALLIIAGPLACLVAATVGQAALFAAGFVDPGSILLNWATWWVGDTLGVLVFLPLTVLSPWGADAAILWKDRALAGFSFGALATVLVSLGLTLFVWFWAHETRHAKNLESFSNIAADSERALLHRMENYEIALEAGAGFYTAHDWVTAADWRTFTEAIRIEETLPGINGIGFIRPIHRNELETFIATKGASGLHDLVIHPKTGADELFVITLIEPVAPNRQAVGLDIAFEKNRYDAAVTSRDTGISTITRRIFLVQDNVKRAGFLLLRPLYEYGAPLRSIEERRASFRGWIYAPFIGQRFIEDLTASQDSSLTISVYDGPAADPELEIYSGPNQHAHGRRPRFRLQKTIPVMNHEWTVVWESTPAFEASVRQREAEIVLVSGLSLTAMLGALLMSLSRRELSIRAKVIEKTSELAAREKEYMAIFDTAAAAILLLDNLGRILTTNSVARDMFAARDGGTIFDLVDDFDLSALGAWQSASQGQQRKVLSARGANGVALFVELEANRWTTITGEERFTVILLDVTEETKIAAELAESEVRLDFTLTGTGVGIFDIDLVEGTSTVSQTWRNIFGFAEQDDIRPQEEWLNRVHPDDLPDVLENDRRCIEGETCHSSTEYRIYRADGELIWVRSVAFVSKRDKDGRALRMTGTQVDIQDHKRALESLKLSEARFRSAMENAPVGTALVSSAGDIVDVNDALCKFLGYEKSELEALQFGHLMHKDHLPRPFLPRTPPFLDALAQSEVQFKRKDGRLVWGLFTSSLVRGNERDSYAIVQILDVDDRRKVDAMKRDFIATVSHELRTPLTSIRSSLGMLRMSAGKDVTEGTGRLITIAQNNCDRLVGLVNDILDLEKLVSGNMKIELEPIDAIALVSKVVADLQLYGAAQDVAVELRHDPHPCIARSNPDRFAQILTNLVSNAVKFSPAGGTVLVEVRNQGDDVVIEVSDTGPGIPEEFQERIFSRFAQANSSNTRNPGGTGLGLNIAKELVESMSGNIGFASEEGRGSTFWFSFASLDCSPHPA